MIKLNGTRNEKRHESLPFRLKICHGPTHADLRKLDSLYPVHQKRRSERYYILVFLLTTILSTHFLSISFLFPGLLISWYLVAVSWLGSLPFHSAVLEPDFDLWKEKNLSSFYIFGAVLRLLPRDFFHSFLPLSPWKFFSAFYKKFATIFQSDVWSMQKLLLWFFPGSIFSAYLILKLGSIVLLLLTCLSVRSRATEISYLLSLVR